MNLLASEQLGEVFEPIYADCLGTAIVSRLLALRPDAADVGRRPVAELAKRRLERVFDHIDAHMDEQISLADVAAAAAAGLSRMHFAAQFDTATGFRPHEYLLRRRIELA